MMFARLPRWEFFASLCAGALGAVFLGPQVFEASTGEIVTLLGFLIAAFVPAMVLAASTLRPGSFSAEEVARLGAALTKQIQLFGGLFFYSISTCILVIIGKAADWSLKVPLPSRAGGLALDLGFVLSGLLTYLLTFIVLRSGAFVSGMLSVARLTTEIAQDEAKVREANENLQSDAELEAYELPSTYGKPLPASAGDTGTEKGEAPPR